MGVWERKGQVAMEYLIIFSISFLMVIPLVIVFATQTENVKSDVANAQVERFADELDAAASEVYYMGEPAKKTFSVTLPQGINQITVYPRMFVVNLTNGERTYDFTKETQVNISGTLKTFSGVHIITVESKGSYVQISDK